jgi:GT2 family glycosyltransferase
MSAPLFSVVIVTWNGWSLTERTLRSLYEDAAGRDVEIIVADNGSTDGTVDRLVAEFPAVRTLAFNENLGFATANNRAIQHASAPLVFLLNNDTVVLRGTLTALLDAAARSSAYALFSTQMIQMHAPDRVDNRGLYVDATAHCRQLDTNAPVEPGRGEGEVFGASGGAVVIRAELLSEIGLFDETLGSYWEDCDFACRARAAGYRCLYVPGARILHEGSATGNRLPLRKLALIQRNMAIVCRRWFPFSPLRLWSWLSLVREVYYVVRGVAEGNGGVVLRAKRDAWRWSRARASAPTASLVEWIGVRIRD